MNAEQTKIEEFLKGTLSSLGKYFEENELAYLALTCKIELPIRDRWAFALYEKLLPKYIVSREWCRTDIAILKKEDMTPVALVELKAMYSFDALIDKNWEDYFSRVLKDQEKARHLMKKRNFANVPIYNVLLVTHPQCEIPQDYRRKEKTIKYWEGVNNKIKEYRGDTDQLKKNARSAVSEKLKSVIAEGEIDGGDAFGVKTSVLYWIVRVGKAI